MDFLSFGVFCVLMEACVVERGVIGLVWVWLDWNRFDFFKISSLFHGLNVFFGPFEFRACLIQCADFGTSQLYSFVS